MIGDPRLIPPPRPRPRKDDPSTWIIHGQPVKPPTSQLPTWRDWLFVCHWIALLICIGAPLARYFT